MAQYATVAAITGNGTAYAVNAQGISRVLKAGDVLQQGETLRTVGDVRVELLMEDGRLLAVAPEQTVRLDEHVVELDQRPTAQDSAATEPGASADAVIQALERGVDLSTQLEAAAAGVGGGAGADGGSTFVQLLRIVEGVEPLSYAYDYTSPDLLPDLKALPEGLTSTLTLTADPGVLEGSPGVTYTATLDDPTATDMTVTLSNGAVIVIPAGSTIGSVLVPVQGDDVYKDAETLQVTVSTVQGGEFSALTVNDANVFTDVKDTIQDTTVSLSATSSITEEGVSITYTATLSNPAQEGNPVTVMLSNGETITIAGGASSGTVVHTVTPDEDVYLDPATVSATISSAEGGNFENLVVNSAPAVTSITDTIDTTTVSLATANVTEDAASVSFTATLSNPAQTPVTVVTNLGNITIAAGQTQGTLVVNTQDSDVYLDADSITATVTGVSGGNFEAVDFSQASATAQIADTLDSTTVSLTAAPNFDENGVTLTYTATLGAPVRAGDAPVEVMFTDLNGEARTITISSGNSGTATTSIAEAKFEDVYKEAAADLVVATGVSVSGGNFENLGSPTVGTVNLIDTTDTTTVSVTQVDSQGNVITSDVIEGNPITFRFSVDHAPQGDLMLNVTIGGVDKTVTIAAGELFSDVTVNTRADDLLAQGSATVTAVVNGVVPTANGNYESLDYSAASVNATVVDDGDLVQLQLFAVTTGQGETPVYTQANSMTEDGSVRYVVLAVDGSGNPLPAQPGGTVTVNVGAAGDSATRDGDYTSSSAVTVTVGTEFSIPAIDDALDENSEAFNVSLGSDWSLADQYESVSYSNASVTTTITDNDTVSVSAVGPATEVEGTDLVHTVTMSGVADSDKTYAFDVADVTATAGSDYNATAQFSNGVSYDSATGQITVPAGVSSFTVTFPGLGDLVDENAETYTLSVGGVNATGTITDDDAVSVSAVGPATEVEGTDLVHTVTMSGVADSDKTYAFDVTDVTATAGSDYNATAQFSNGVSYDSATGQITVPAGVSSFTLTFPGLGDLVDENAETYTLSVGGVNATGTILDDDLPPISYENEAAAWLMNEGPDQMSFDIKPKSGGITLNPDGQVHWDILVKGDLGTSPSLAVDLSSKFPSGVNFSYDVLYAPDAPENSTVLFRVFMTSDSAVPVEITADDQFIVKLDPGAGGVVVDSQIINSDEYVRPHANYNDDYSSMLDTGTASLGADLDWLSTFARDGDDVNGGEFSVTPNYLQDGETVADYGPGNDMAYGTVGDDVLGGGEGNDFIDGRAGDDNLAGGPGDDVLVGGMGTDILSGDEGSDVLIGGGGHDAMMGGAGADTFQWGLGDQGQAGGPAIDHTDFNRSDMDRLDLSELLPSESAGNLSQYLSFVDDGEHAVLDVRVDAGGPVVQRVVFDNFDTVAALQAAFSDLEGADLITKMRNNGNLVVD